MSADISPENERFIETQIAGGAFQTRGEALDAAVDILRLRKELLDRIDEGRRQLDAGEYVEYDDEGLRKRFDELKARARQLGPQTP